MMVKVLIFKENLCVILRGIEIKKPMQNMLHGLLYMGLLRQFQRTEQQIYEVVSILLKEAYNCEYKPVNIPNKYLN